MQQETPNREQLRSQLATYGITLDDKRLSTMLPIYTGLLNGARRLATLDLGDTEPAMIFMHSAAPTVKEDRR